MLREAIQYALTPCDPVFRRLGYLAELIAIESRAHRHRKLWQPHWRQCRERILAQLRATPSRKWLVILGGGLVNDIPLEELSQAFARVTLVDVVFSRRTRKLAARLKNVQCVSWDMTQALQLVRETKRPAAVGEVQLFPELLRADPSERPDWVVSVNVLSQLPLVAMKKLRRWKIPEMELQSMARLWMQAHLRALLLAGKRWLLLTDVQETSRLDGEILEVHALLGTLELREELGDRARLLAHWDWVLAPKGEVGPREVTHRVEVWAPV